MTCGHVWHTVYTGPNTGQHGEMSVIDDYVKVPVRRGGPWDGDGTYWEEWHNGVFHTRNPSGCPYRVRKGVLEHLNTHNYWCKVCQTDGLNGVELRAPKGWPKPGNDVPEGCYVMKPPVEIAGGPCGASCRFWGHDCSGCSHGDKWQPKEDKPDEGEFSVGARVCNPSSIHPGTVVQNLGYDARRIRWDMTGVEGVLCLGDLRLLPASDDPLPRKEGVVIYEVTKEEYDKGHVTKHVGGVGHWSAREINIPGDSMWGRDGSTNGNEITVRDIISHVPVGQTWIVCRE